MKWSKRTLPIIFDDHMHPKTFRVKMAEYVNNLLEEAKGNLETPETDGEEGQILQSNGDGTTSWVDALKQEVLVITLNEETVNPDYPIYAIKYGDLCLLYGQPRSKINLGGAWQIAGYLPDGYEFVGNQFFTDAGGSGNIQVIDSHIDIRNYTPNSPIYFSALALLKEST